MGVRAPGEDETHIDTSLDTMWDASGARTYGTESRRYLPDHCPLGPRVWLIEIGQDDMSRSFIRALDDGGMVWEGRKSYPTLDAALQALETALAAWMQGQGL